MTKHEGTNKLSAQNTEYYTATKNNAFRKCNGMMTTVQTAIWYT